MLQSFSAIRRSESRAQGIVVHHRRADDRADETKLLEADAERGRSADGEPIRQFHADARREAQHEIFAAEIVEDGARRAAAIFRAQSAEARQAEAERRRDAETVEVLRNAHFGNDEALGARRDAEWRSAVEGAVVGDGRIAFGPTAAERELSSFELRQRRRVAADRRGHILRLREANARHAARRRRHRVLQIGAVSLAVCRGNICSDDECACNGERTSV